MRTVIGRVKIEIRPLLLISAETKDKRGDVIFQNAETIKLVRENGSLVSVVNLKKGVRYW